MLSIKPLFILQQIKRKLEDVGRKLEILYDKLRENSVSYLNSSKFLIRWWLLNIWIVLMDMGKSLICASKSIKKFTYHNDNNCNIWWWRALQYTFCCCFANLIVFRSCRPQPQLDYTKSKMEYGLMIISHVLYT